MNLIDVELKTSNLILLRAYLVIFKKKIENRFPKYILILFEIFLFWQTQIWIAVLLIYFLFYFILLCLWKHFKLVKLIFRKLYRKSVKKSLNLFVLLEQIFKILFFKQNLSIKFLTLQNYFL